MKLTDRLGERKIMNNGMIAEIIRYGGWEDIDVKFEDGYIAQNKRYSSFKKGSIKNNNIKTKTKTLENERLHQINYNIYGTKLEIIKYNTYDDIDVKIYDKDNTIKYNTRYLYFKNGTIISPYDKTVCGIGYIGIPCYSKDEKETPLSDLLSYQYWSCMVKRCYDNKTLVKSPTYLDKIVCEEWMNFSNFKIWFDNNYYEIKGEKMQLDKDILIKNNNIYNPQTCVFVPNKINMLFVKADKIRGDYPIGVYFDTNKSKFCSCLSINNKHKHLGCFNTPTEAFQAYKQAKEKYIKEVADQYKDKIPRTLYEAMYKYEVEITD